VSSLIVRYEDGHGSRWGRLVGAAPLSPEDEVRLLPLPWQAETTATLLKALQLSAVQDDLNAATIRASALLSPITADATLVCQGLNYASHAQEARHGDRKSNLIFGKASSSITGPYAAIIRPTEVELLDYEVEFALVMRRALGAGDGVSIHNIGEYVAGIVLCNDVSARDVQFGESLLQWYRGKSYRTFCPVGPALWLLDPAEVAPALDALNLTLAVNGESRQKASSQQLIFKPVETLNYVGSVMDLKAGDLLLTGTPGGVTAPVTPRMVEIIQTHLMHDEVRRDQLRAEMTKGRRFLRHGDIVTATLSDASTGQLLGGLRNPVVDAKHV
jgi:2-keto-4-pentenoate hydratase/2-oxohepta-3-ene-1,7-dioic acid hydratase in catechol pathway